MIDNMKKLLAILVLSLLVCNIAQAKECKGSPFEEKNNILILFKILVKWKDCYGTLTYKDGSKYIGEFKRGRFSGQGIFTWLDGVKYVGEFKNGKRHGQGTYTWTDGTIDNGIWKKDKLVKRNKIEISIDKKESKKKEAKLVKKKITQTQSSSSECKESPLKEKKFALKLRKAVVEWRDCHGTLIYKDGSKYSGEFKGGKFSGLGTFTYKDGATYFGEFIEGKSNGQGTYTWPDGKKYVGEWKDDVRHGQGIFTNQLGETYEGEF